MLAVASTMHAAAGMQVCVNAGTRWDARTLTPLGDDLTADGVGQSDDIQFPFFTAGTTTIGFVLNRAPTRKLGI